MRVSIHGAFVAVLLILLTSGDAFARGGARAGRGGPSAGRAAPGGFQRSGPATRPNTYRSNAAHPLPNPNAQFRPGQVNPQAQAARIRDTAGARYTNMFTPQWYRNHPAAWHARHPHADLWAAATWAALAGWVGVHNYPVVYGDNGSTVYLDGEGAETNVSAQDPAEAVADTGEWLPLGVFALVPDGNRTETYFILQLAINKQGVIGGSYYDIVADSVLPLQGSIDKNTNQAVWTIGPNKTTVMQTDLKNLTKNQSPVQMRLGKDRKQDWRLVRLENAK